MKITGYIALAGMFVFGLFCCVVLFLDAQAADKCRHKEGIYASGHCYTKTKEIPL